MATDKCIPKKKKKMRITNRRKFRPIWMNENTLAKVKKKHQTWKRYKLTKDGKDYNAYARARNRARWPWPT